MPRASNNQPFEICEEELSKIPQKYWDMYQSIDEDKVSITDAYKLHFDPKTDNERSVYSMASNIWNSKKMKLVKLASLNMKKEQSKRSLEYRIREIEADIEECRQAGQYGAMSSLRKLLLQLEGQLENRLTIRDERLETASLLLDLKRNNISQEIYQALEQRLGISDQRKDHDKAISEAIDAEIIEES